MATAIMNTVTTTIMIRYEEDGTVWCLAHGADFFKDLNRQQRSARDHESIQILHDNVCRRVQLLCGALDKVVSTIENWGKTNDNVLPLEDAQMIARVGKSAEEIAGGRALNRAYSTHSVGLMGAVACAFRLLEVDGGFESETAHAAFDQAWSRCNLAGGLVLKAAATDMLSIVIKKMIKRKAADEFCDGIRLNSHFDFYSVTVLILLSIPF